MSDLPYVPELMTLTGAIVAGLKDANVATQAEAHHAVTIELDGDYTHTTTTLCSHCPRGEHGCCASPPSYWPSDLALVALAGGAQWLVDQVRSGNLVQRSDGELQPITRDGACVYWRAGKGCTISAGLRPPYCNYWICGEALDGLGLTREAAAGLGGMDPARAMREYLWQRRHHLSEAIAGEMGARGEWPPRLQHPKRARRALEAMAALIRPRLSACMAPKRGRLRYVGHRKSEEG